MEVYDSATYGEHIAAVYDDWYADYDPAAIDTLARLARHGPTLELGIGTGRIALPLRERGVPVQGVDASPAMVERLRQKPGGAEIPVTLGDFTDLPVSGEFALIYIVFNTLFALLTQEAQVRCFQSVASHLQPDGIFLVEAFVPDLKRFQDGQAVRAVTVEEGAARLDISQHDPVNQRIYTQHVLLSEQGVRLYPVQLRYIFPAEMDLMARLAGLRLVTRWGNWQAAPFTASSGRHISLYGR